MFVGVCSATDAHNKHVTQLSASGCGATAVVNVLMLLDIVSIQSLSSLDYSCCILRTRQNDAPLPQYLRSRFDAGCTGEELVDSIRRIIVSNELSVDLEAKFVSYSSIKGQQEGGLVEYLADKFNDGWVAIATLNLQIYGNDAWHHQVIYGADTVTRDLYLMNPMEKIHEREVVRALDTDSVLLVRQEDILQRIDRSGADWSILEDSVWKPFDIATQIEKMKDNKNKFPFVIIPAAYVGGLALFRARPR